MQTAVASVVNSFRLFPNDEIREGRYTVRIARDRFEIDEALRLRFEVFNLELGEGDRSSFLTGRDTDEFDATCKHLVAIDNESGKVIGTYRLQTIESARSVEGFYSSGEFDLTMLPSNFLANSIELGRACIAKDHRNTKVLYLMWKVLITLMDEYGKRYLFGCCSLTGIDCATGIRTMASLRLSESFHKTLWTMPKQGFECVVDKKVVFDHDAELPKLFKAYLRFGVQVCSAPAIDRGFGTTDFLVVFDKDNVNELARRMFFADITYSENSEFPAACP